jgi:isopenicillin-N epimerase
MTSHSRSDLSQSIRPPREGHAALGEFALAPDLVHLNHGSYGAIPRRVQDEQDRWRATIERNPTGFFQWQYPAEIRRAATVAAANFGGESKDWVFCENATAAVSSVLASLPLNQGDNILTTSHAYGAVVKAIRLSAERRGASLQIANTPVIVESDSQIVEALATAFTERTRLLVIDHITSPTAIVFPVAQIVRLAHDAGIPVLVDGAHGPGHLDLDVPAIGADWYTGNAHKWFFAPRGCGLLWTTTVQQDITRPAVLSHGTEQGYTAAFDWIGTRDTTPWLCLGAAAEAYAAFGGKALIERNRAVVTDGAAIVAKAIGGTKSAPAEMCGAMVSLCFPGIKDAAETGLKLRLALREAGIVAAAGGINDHVFLRLSAQIYNQASDFSACANALQALGFAGDFPNRSS